MAHYDHRRLRAARESAGLTQPAAAAGIGKALSTYVRYEAGVVVPPVPVLADLALLFGVDIGELFDAEPVGAA